MSEGATMSLRLIVTTDLVGYGGLTSRGTEDFQQRQVALLDGAFRRTGIDRGQRLPQPGGDSTVDLLPPGIDEERVVSGVILQLTYLLRDDNRHRTEPGRIRLRLAIGQGRAGAYVNGHKGDAVSRVCRLRDSDVSKDAIRAVPAADLVVLLDDELYRSVIPDNTYGLEEADFTKVQVRGKPTDRQPDLTGWIWVPRHPYPGPAGPRQDAIGPVDKLGGLIRPGGPLPEGGPF